MNRNVNMFLRFDSRNPKYKSVTGAVKAGQTVKFRLFLSGSQSCGDVFFVIRSDSQTAPEYRYMHCTYSENGGMWYEIDADFWETGLYWYHFEYDSDWSRKYVMKGAFNHEWSEGTEWQQTVYSADFKTPDWMKGGVMYQIFPDRFYASGAPKENVPADRFMAQKWGDIPEHRQTDEPKSLGNDYFGGDLRGITEKLYYLNSLGVTVIYLNPIFEAHSNHRYNTASYEKIDPLLGNEEDFAQLCQRAAELGMKIILDGVFSHTGADSIYFDKNARYHSGGAYQTTASKYYSWYKFQRWPDKYSAWWGVPSLPEVEETDPGFLDYITGQDGILQKWMRLGAFGYRLDVADELPDIFLEKLRQRVKSQNPDALVLGEVWEDASNKISYGSRRSFLLGAQLDSVMNYPFANAILSFAKGGDGAELLETVESILEHYPAEVVHCLMNHIGTHDTARAMTALGGEDPKGRGRDWQSQQSLSEAQYALAEKRLCAAALIQYTLPGVPSLYYGDEAGMTGYGDPFCRGCFPWGEENYSLTAHYRMLGAIRRSYDVFKDGNFIPVRGEEGFVSYIRQNRGKKLFVAVNVSDTEKQVSLSAEFRNHELVAGVDGADLLTLKPYQFSVIYTEEN